MKRFSVSNVSKEQLENASDELTESWRHQQQQTPSYAPPISSSADPYSAAGRDSVCPDCLANSNNLFPFLGYYGTAGTAPFTYQTFGVNDGTWSANGTVDNVFLGGYAQHETYGLEGFLLCFIFKFVYAFC